MDNQEIRAAALNAAVELYAPALTQLLLCPGVDASKTVPKAIDLVGEVADRFEARIRGTVTMKVFIGTPREQQLSESPNELTASYFKMNAKKEGTEMHLSDTQECDVTVSTRDRRGFATSDAITYTVEPEGVVEVDLGTDDDSHTATIRAVAPGSALVTLTDDSVDPPQGPLVASIAVDVTTGPTVAIDVSEGTPREQATPPEGGGGEPTP